MRETHLDGGVGDSGRSGGLESSMWFGFGKPTVAPRQSCGNRRVWKRAGEEMELVARVQPWTEVGYWMPVF